MSVLRFSPSSIYSCLWQRWKTHAAAPASIFLCGCLYSVCICMNEVTCRWGPIFFCQWPNVSVRISVLFNTHLFQHLHTFVSTNKSKLNNIKSMTHRKPSPIMIFQSLVTLNLKTCAALSAGINLLPGLAPPHATPGRLQSPSHTCWGTGRVWAMRCNKKRGSDVVCAAPRAIVMKPHEGFRVLKDKPRLAGKESVMRGRNSFSLFLFHF